MARSRDELRAIFHDTAAAIRTKTGKTTTFTPRDFADEIMLIDTSGGEHPLPKLFAPLNFNFDIKFGKVSCDANTKNGDFDWVINFYLNNELLYRGRETEFSNIFYYIKDFGKNTLYTSTTCSLFQESDKPAIDVYVNDLGGYFLFRPDGYRWAAKMINDYTVETNPNGETVVINGDEIVIEGE